MSDNFCSEFTKFLKKYPIQSCALVLVICFLLGDKFEKKFAAVGSVGSVFIGYAAYRISKEQHRATEQKISDEKRKLIKEHCQKTLDAIVKASYFWKRSGKENENSFDEAISEIFKSRESAKIELNDDFADLIERIYLFYLDLSVQYMDAAKEKRALGGEKALENRNKESALKNELENLYARYLKLPN